MQRALLICAVLAAVSAAPATAETQMYFGFRIEIGDAPPPPRFSHASAPRLVMVPDLEVYVIANDDLDHDIFRYGAFWYMCDGGYWYRAKRYRGPYALISVRSVPTPIFYVPRERWRHHHWGPKWIRKSGHDGERRSAWARARHARHRGHHAHEANVRKHDRDRAHDKSKDKHAVSKKTKQATSKGKHRAGKDKQVASNDKQETGKHKDRGGKDRH